MNDINIVYKNKGLNTDNIRKTERQILATKLFPTNEHLKINEPLKNELKLCYRKDSRTKVYEAVGDHSYSGKVVDYPGDNVYNPPEERFNDLCEMFDDLYCSGDSMKHLEFSEIKRLRTSCLMMEQSNNDLEYVLKRLEHENKCFEPRIAQLKQINKSLVVDNAEYLGRSVENKFLLKDVTKMRGLLDSLTHAVKDEVNNHCRLQEDYFKTDFNRKQSEKDQMSYELSSIATNHQLSSLTIKKTFLESCKEDLIKKQVFVNRLQDIKGMFRVALAIRPVQCQNNESIFSLVTDDKVAIKSSRSINKQIKVYQFNKVFAGYANQNEIADSLDGCINQIINGYNVCFIHFGTSGSGKTYTVIGSLPEQLGLSSIFISKLIDGMNKEHRMRFKIEASFLEFYNDNVSCLISGNKIKFQDTGKNIIIGKYGKKTITSLNSFNQVLLHVSQRRKTSATCFCNEASRSHLAIIIWVKSENSVTGGQINSRLFICDLAGFEKSTGYTHQKIRKQHMDEIYHINNSLSALSQIIEEFNVNKIKSTRFTKGKSTLPFRSSKLTQFLKPSFCGDAYCYLILHISDDIKQIHSICKTLQLGQIAMSTELGIPICHKSELISSSVSKYIV